MRSREDSAPATGCRDLRTRADALPEAGPLDPRAGPQRVGPELDREAGGGL